MKQLVCEMCGSTELMKQDGVFVCQTCGCKYSVEEAKKMMVEGTVEVAGIVKIDRSDNYNNLVQQARDAIADGRFDGAYQHCSEALLIVPNDPEMIALQGLAVLGKEEIITDVPTSCVNAMNRMKSVMPDYEAPFDKKREMLYSLKKNVGVVIKHKKVLYDEQINDLSSQKVDYKASEETGAAANLALQSLGGNIFTQQKAEADLEKAKAKRLHNEGLDAKISKIRDKICKMESFADKFKKEVDVCLQMVNKEEREYKEERKAAYWENHKEEKEQLDSRLATLKEQLKPITETVTQKRNEMNEIDRELRNAEVPSYKKREKLRDEVRDLERRRANLGLFKGKEKKQITENIARIEAQMPADTDIQREMDELKRTKQPQLDALISELIGWEKQVAELNAQISEVNAELTKER